jgi:hypothetical protein
LDYRGYGAVDHIGNTIPGQGYNRETTQSYRGFGQVDETGEPEIQTTGIPVVSATDPWDTSKWGITEWAAAAGLIASVFWVWHLSKGK